MTNPILSQFENVSPAQSLGFVTEVDGDGYPVNAIDLSVGDIVISTSGHMYRVEGFTYDNEVIVTQHGLNRDQTVHSLLFEGKYLRHLPREEYLMHKDGLVAFEGEEG